MRNLGKNEVEFKESWNKKRIITALIILALLVAGAIFLTKSGFTPNNPNQKEVSTVLSASNENLEDAIQKQIESLKEQAANIDVEEIASSSPQIQNLVNDLKALQDLPRNQAREACMNICKSF